MEHKDGFPEHYHVIDIKDTLKSLGRATLSLLSPLPTQTFSTHGRHDFENKGNNNDYEQLDESSPAFEQLAWQFDKDSRQ